MIKLLLTLHMWGLALLDQTLTHTVDRVTTTLQAPRRRRHGNTDDRGSVTIEQVIWAGAVIVIVGVVVAAITTFVRSESAKIK